MVFLASVVVCKSNQWNTIFVSSHFYGCEILFECVCVCAFDKTVVKYPDKVDSYHDIGYYYTLNACIQNRHF